MDTDIKPRVEKIRIVAVKMPTRDRPDDRGIIEVYRPRNEDMSLGQVSVSARRQGIFDHPLSGEDRLAVIRFFEAVEQLEGLEQIE